MNYMTGIGYCLGVFGSIATIYVLYALGCWCYNFVNNLSYYDDDFLKTFDWIDTEFTKDSGEIALCCFALLLIALVGSMLWVISIPVAIIIGILLLARRQNKFKKELESALKKVKTTGMDDSDNNNGAW